MPATRSTFVSCPYCIVASQADCKVCDGAGIVDAAVVPQSMDYFGRAMVEESLKAFPPFVVAPTVEYATFGRPQKPRARPRLPKQALRGPRWRKLVK